MPYSALSFLILEGDVLLPQGVGVGALVDDVVAGGWGRGGLAEQLHGGPARWATSFVVVARLAGAHHIVPGVLSPQVTRYHMVYGEVIGPFAAILAGVVVAAEYLSPRQLLLGAGPPDEINEADDRRQGEAEGGAMYGS